MQGWKKAEVQELKNGLGFGLRRNKVTIQHV